jgi:hypothetical protein
MRSAVALTLIGLLGLGAPAGAWDKPETPTSGPEGGHAVPRGGGPDDEGSKPTSSTGNPDDPSKPTPSSSEVREQKQDKAERRPPTDAQLRHPRAGTGYGAHRNEDYRHYQAYNPYYYGYATPYWAPYYYGYGYYGPAPYGYHGYPAVHGHEREAGAVRLQVPQEDASVYVDGHYAGKVDDFNGAFERLYLEPGNHEIMLRKDGYRTYRIRIYVPLDQTLKIRYEMLKGEGEDRVDLVDPEPPAEVRGGPAGHARLEEPAAPAAEAESWGRLRLDVRPDDATIYVDGEFRGQAIDLRSLKLPAGMHKVEVVRPGFGTLERDVEVKPGETADFTAELGRS